MEKEIIDRYIALQRIRYYFRCELYGACISIASEVITESSKSCSSILFWKAWAQAMSGNIKEALCDFEYLRHRNKQVAYPALAATIYFQCRAESTMPKQCGLKELETSLNESKEFCSVEGWILAAYFQIHLGNQAVAARYLERCVKFEEREDWRLEVLICEAWHKLKCKVRPENAKVSAFLLEFVLSFQGKETLESVLFVSYFRQIVGDIDGAIHVLRENYRSVTEQHQIVKIEHSKLLAIQSRYNEALQVISLVVEKDKGNIEALRCQTMYEILQNGVTIFAISNLSAINETVNESETLNSSLCYSLSHTFARISFGKHRILEWTLNLLQQCISTNQSEERLQQELGFQLALLHEFGKSLQIFSKVCSSSPSVSSYFGIINNLFELGKMDEAKMQLQYFITLCDDPDERSIDYFMILARQDKLSRKFLNYVENMSIVASMLKRSSESLTSLDLTSWLVLLLQRYQFVSDVWSMCGISGNGNYLVEMVASKTSSSLLTLVKQELDFLTQQYPGCSNVFLLLAERYFCERSIEKSLSNVKKVLKLDSKNLSALYLQAKIQISEGMTDDAEDTIYYILDVNPLMENSISFKFVSWKLAEKRGVTYNIKEMFQDLMRIFSSPEDISEFEGFSTRASALAVANECSKALAIQDQVTMALELLSAARKNYDSSPHEMYVVETMARLMSDRLGYKYALEFLSGIPSDSVIHWAVSFLKADISYEKDKDSDLYRRSYLRIVSEVDCLEAYNVLGNSLLRINLLADAVKYGYEKSLNINPSQPHVYQVIIHAYEDQNRLVDAEEWCKKASNFIFGNITLARTISDFYLKIQKVDDAISILSVEISREKKTEEELTYNMELLLRLAEIQTDHGMTQELERSLEQILVLRENQVKPTRAIFDAQPSKDDKEFDQGLLLRLARCKELLSKMDDAEKYYKTALLHNRDETTAIALSRLHLNCGAPELVDDILTGFESLKVRELKAEAAFWLGNHEEAICIYSRLVQEHQNDSMLLGKFVEIMWKSGHFKDVKKLLEQIESRELDPKLYNESRSYICAICARFSRNSNKAFENFNLVIKVSEGEVKNNAIEHLLKLQLYEIPGCRGKHSSIVAVKGLIEEFTSRSPKHARKPMIFKSLYLAATSRADNVVQAHKLLEEILSVDNQYIPAYFAKALISSLTGEKTKARTIWKQSLALPFRAEYSEEMERIQLALATVFSLEEGKEALIEALCNKCLRANKSCLSALKILGMQADKRGSKEIAIDCFEKALDLLDTPDQDMAIRLATLSLQSGKFVHALDTWERIISFEPSNETLKGEILVPSVEGLRP